MNFRVRLTLIFALIFGVMTISFNLVVFDYSIDALRRDFDDALYNYCIDISDSIEHQINNGRFNVGSIDLEQEKILPFSLGTTRILLRNRSGKILSQYGNLGNYQPPFEDQLEKIKTGTDVTFKTLHDVQSLPSSEADSYRLITFPLENQNPEYFIQVLAPRTLLETQIENRLQVIQVGIPLAILISMILGYFLSGRALIPVTEIIHKTRSIKANVLSERVPVSPTRDEFRELALTMNQMLDRIEKSFQSQERFVADASHQLLSPLTILKSSLESKLKESSMIPDLRAFLTDQETEVNHLIDIIKDMLLLARLDAGLHEKHFANIHLEEIILKAISSLRRRSHTHQPKVLFNIVDNDQSSPKVTADPDLLKHLFYNLIENAMKYSPPDSQIRIDLIWDKEFSIVKVADEGPGISDTIAPILFERFSRAPEMSQLSGYGLGLAIVKKISDLHQSSIEFNNLKPRGCEFQFKIKNN
ncbi:MAG: HAMP domain-containing histidine kinase [Bdellovibrionaceae bacterium]|nr:HAMP domain-containing histidine kinase [Pseudobdellovibrionaceae bacterium]